jgi:hypothetical protein
MADSNENRAPHVDQQTGAAAPAPRSSGSGVANGAQLGAPEEDGHLVLSIARLRAFYRPHMQRLFAWADAGLVSQPPASWREAYRAATA